MERKNHIEDWEIEALKYNTLDEDYKREIFEHIDNCRECQNKIFGKENFSETEFEISGVLRFELLDSKNNIVKSYTRIVTMPYLTVFSIQQNFFLFSLLLLKETLWVILGILEEKEKENHNNGQI